MVAPRTQKRADVILKALGIFRTADAVEKAISQPSLSRMTKEGTLVRLEHGIFMHRDFDKPEQQRFLFLNQLHHSEGCSP